MKRLTILEVEAKMKSIDRNWILKENLILREFLFDDFKQAFSFITSVSLIAEKHDHHPNWKNVYNKVEIRLFTHEVNGLTERDFKLAKEIDQIIVRSQEIVSKTIDVE